MLNTLLRIVVLFALPVVAGAHSVDEASLSFAAGLAHPLTGLDHLLAMIAVGVWAGYLGRRASLTLPMAFPLAMLCGAALANMGVALPAIEPAIAASAVCLGLLIALRVDVNVIAASALVGAFAVFHGYAHASEAPAVAQIAYGIGFIASTVALHLSGLWLAAKLFRRVPRAVAWAGAAVSIAGVALLLAQ